MAHVVVTIAGRAYRMACGDGEEAHLEGLAASFDAKVAEMRGAFGEIGDMRLQVMAALTLADDLAETKRRVEALEGEIAALKAVSSAGIERADKMERQLADTLARAAERVELLARSVAPGGAAS
jgi:cell division protein ZapA